MALYRQARPAYTLVELLITMMIVAILAGMVLVVYSNALETAKAQKTRSLIAKLDSIVKARWDSYRTRRVGAELGDEVISSADIDGDGQITTAGDFLDYNNNGTPNPGEFDDKNGNGTPDAGEIPDFNNSGSPPDPGECLDINGNGAVDNVAIVAGGEWTDYNRDGMATAPYVGKQRAKMRIDCLRDMMRMEMPDRWTDITAEPIAPLTFPAVDMPPSVYRSKMPRTSNNQEWFRRYTANPPSANAESAECLYLIVQAAVRETGEEMPKGAVDSDGDGWPEFVDGWGKPIKFLRWAPGFNSELNSVALGSAGVTINNPVSAQLRTVTVNVNVPPGPGIVNNKILRTTQGAYVAGAIATKGPNGQIDPEKISPITGYEYNTTTGQATITCSLPSYTAMPLPGLDGELIILPPDPFDPTRVYPIYPPGMAFAAGTPDTSRTTFAIYPLIFSAGPDKCFGVATDPDPTSPTPLAYATFNLPDGQEEVALNPFYLNPTTKTLVGAFKDNPSEEPFVEGGWRDNIHNHLIGLR